MGKLFIDCVAYNTMHCWPSSHQSQIGFQPQILTPPPPPPPPNNPATMMVNFTECRTDM